MEKLKNKVAEAYAWGYRSHGSITKEEFVEIMAQIRAKSGKYYEAFTSLHIPELRK